MLIYQEKESELSRFGAMTNSVSHKEESYSQQHIKWSDKTMRALLKLIDTMEDDNVLVSEHNEISNILETTSRMVKCP